MKPIDLATLRAAALAGTLAPVGLVVVLFFLNDLWNGNIAQVPGLLMFALFALVVAGAHVLVLGIPVFLALRRLRDVRAWHALLVGALVGAGPSFLYEWHGDQSPSYSAWDGSKMVTYIENGVRTAQGWGTLVQGTIAYAVLGAIGGLAFWLVAVRRTHL